MRLLLHLAGACVLTASLGGASHLPGTPSLGDVHLGARSEVPGPACPPPRRVVSAALVADELLAELLPLDRFAAVSFVADWSVAALREPFPAHIPRTSGTAEDILAYAPDLVVVSDYNGAATVAQLKSAGLCVAHVPAPHGFRELLESIERLGASTARQEAAARWAGSLRRELARIASLPSLDPQPRALVLRGTQAFGLRTLQDECLRLAGLDNAAADAGVVGMPSLAPETILTADADVIFVGTETQAAQGARRDRLPAGIPWRASRAWQEHRVYEVPAKWVVSLTHHAVSACGAYAELVR